MNICSRSVVVLSLCALVSCADPGETTGLGAATGGVIGAGLGAIVGSATGNAGPGLVIGAVVGSASGAAVGNVIEGQQQTIHTQDEAIERHERMIAAQRGEIEELRRVDMGPNAMLRNSSITALPDAPPSMHPGRDTRPTLPALSAPRSAVEPVRRELLRAPVGPAALPVRETTIVESPQVSALRRDFANSQSEVTRSNVAKPEIAMPAPAPRFAEPAAPEASDLVDESVAPVVGSSAGALNPSTEENMGAECAQAADEIGKAKRSSELADQLFHYRRALRLCPESPGYHNGLGEIYLALNRKADAEFEFREALRLRPDFPPAVQNLNTIR